MYISAASIYQLFWLRCIAKPYTGNSFIHKVCHLDRNFLKINYVLLITGESNLLRILVLNSADEMQMLEIRNKILTQSPK